MVCIAMSTKVIFISLAVLMSCVAAASAGPTNNVVGDLRAKYERQLGILDVEAGSNLQVVVVWYGQQFQPLRERLKKAEDVEGLIAVKAEEERFLTSRTLPPEGTATNAALKSLRSDLATRCEQMRADAVKRHTTLIRQYMNALAMKRRELIAADNLVDAAAVNDEIKRVEAVAASLESKTCKPPDSGSAAGGEPSATPKPSETSH